MKLKLLTFNIHKGFDWNKKNFSLEKIKKFVKKSGAHLVFLQEVVGKNSHLENKGLIDRQFEFIADSVWKHYSYAQNAIFDHGHHGNLILSAYPISTWKNFNVSTNYFEKRGLLWCQIRLPAKAGSSALHVICVHLDLLDRGRKKQYRRLQELVQSLKIKPHEPLVIAGDFNDWNKRACEVLTEEMHLTEAHLFHHGRLARTFPAFFPFLSLDRIYVRNLKVRDCRVMTAAMALSDHLPLYCEVEIEEK